MLGTAPSGSVQLQDYCVRPEKIGEPFFQSLSEVVPSSDPSRHTEVPGYTYSALSSRWRGLSVSDVRTCPTPYALDALAQPSNRILAPQRSWDGLMTGRNLSPHSQSSWAGQHEAAVTASRFSHGSSADMPGYISVFQRSP